MYLRVAARLCQADSTRRQAHVFLVVYDRVETHTRRRLRHLSLTAGLSDRAACQREVVGQCVAAQESSACLVRFRNDMRFETPPFLGQVD